MNRIIRSFFYCFLILFSFGGVVSLASESGLNNGINSQELFLSPVSETNQAGETSTESFFHFKQDNILFVTSHNISFLWHNSFFQSFSDHLMKSSQRAINIDLIVVKNRDDNILVPSARYVDLIEAQLEEYDYDMIIADGNEVANLFFNNILIVPKECIFVFCNYIGEGYKEAKISNMTGFVLPETEIENLKLGAKLFPNAKKGVLIVDGTEAGEVLCETALKRRDEIPLEEVEIISGSDYSTQGMLTKLKTLDPEKDFVVFYSWRSQHSPKIYNSQEVVDIMKNTFHGPILNGWDAYTKLGFLGGEVIKTEDASLALVSIVNQIFRGVKPEIIPIETCKTHLIFNYDGLQKFNLRPSMILDQFELINQPKPFVERNMTFILSLFSLLLLLLIVALIYQYFKLVQMNRPISLLRLLPIGLVVTDFDGKILFLSSGLLFKNRIAKGSYIQDIALYNGELCQKILDTLRENKNLESNSGNFKYNGHQWVLTAQRIDYNVFGKEVLFWVSSDVEDMYRMLRVEQGIGDILSDLILQRSFDIIISRSFDLMVNYIDADRMGFFEFNSTTNSFTRKKSWIRNEKIPPPDEKIINTLYKQYGEEIRNNGLYLSSKVVDPEKYKVVEDDLKGRSILIVPCFINGKFWGMITASAMQMRHDFNEADRFVLSNVAKIISLARIHFDQLNYINMTNEQMEIMIDTISIPIWFYDKKGNFLRGNKALEKLSSASKNSLKHKNGVSYVELEKEYNENSVEEVIKTRKEINQEIIWQNRYFDLYTVPVLNNKGEILYVIKSAVESTNLKRLLRNQSLLNECLQSVFENRNEETALETLAKIIGKHFRVSRCAVLKYQFDKAHLQMKTEYVAPGGSPVFRKEEFYPIQGDFLVKKFLEYRVVSFADFQDEYFPKSTSNDFWKNLLTEKLNTQSAYFVPIWFSGKLWGSLYLSFEDEQYVFPTQDYRILFLGAHLIEIIVENRYRLEGMLRAVDRAQAADKAKSYFIASVSHEIRTPLNSIIGFSELLQKSNTLNEEERQYLNNIIFSGNALLMLVNDVLNLSKLESGKMKKNPIWINFNILGEDVLKIFELSAAAKKNSLEIRCEKVPLLKLDYMQIRQILINLIGNAVKFTEGGRIILTAVFKPNSDENVQTGVFKFCISDTGIGIRPEDQVRLMEPFVQLSNMRGTNTINTGTGLGLSICKRLAENMGGKIWIKSKYGKGSTFGVDLQNIPYSYKEKQQIVDINSRSIGEEFKNSTLQVSKERVVELLKEWSILLVDDVPLNCKVLGLICKNVGLKKIKNVSNGQAALDLMDDIHFDLILTDLWMPEMSGFEMLKKIRSNPKNNKTMVVAVTADIEFQEVSSFDLVLYKPVTQDKFMELLQKIVFLAPSGSFTIDRQRSMEKIRKVEKKKDISFFQKNNP